MSSLPKPAPSRHRQSLSAFTLLEILVVLAIIGLLAGLAITNVDKIFGGAQADTAKVMVNQSLKAPLTAYRIATGSYPTTSEGLQALVTPPKPDKMPRGVIDSMPLDPWGEPLQYAFPGTHNKDSYDLWSKGPDKQSGTADDIGNWETGGSREK